MKGNIGNSYNKLNSLAHTIAYKVLLQLYLQTLKSKENNREKSPKSLNVSGEETWVQSS